MVEAAQARIDLCAHEGSDRPVARARRRTGGTCRRLWQARADRRRFSEVQRWPGLQHRPLATRTLSGEGGVSRDWPRAARSVVVSRALWFRCRRRSCRQGHSRRAERIRRADHSLSERGGSTGAVVPASWRSGLRSVCMTPELQAKIDRLDALLDSIAQRHEHVKLASSLAAEDMLLTHAILSRGVGIGIFSLNTGRLHAETLGMIDRVKERYAYDIEQLHPQQEAVDEYVRDHGLNAFYESIDLRKSCCGIRKG